MITVVGYMESSSLSDPCYLISRAASGAISLQWQHMRVSTMILVAQASNRYRNQGRIKLEKSWEFQFGTCWIVGVWGILMGTGSQELGNTMSEAESRGKGWAGRLGVICIQ